VNQSIYHFCTYFDINYLTRGLALYESLRRHCRRPFVLWVLCFDEETHALLESLDLPGLQLISQAKFEASDTVLTATKTDRTRVEYFWTCTPSLPLYVFSHHPAVEILTYLDADLYFFSDPSPIFVEMGDSSVLIAEHRYPPEHAWKATMFGIYNVGWLSFRADANGMACLEWWRERCLEWCYARHEDGKFGDQLYLDEWPARFADVAVLQHKGAGLAPWNVVQYQLQVREQQLTVDEEPLIFFHFHGLRCVHPQVVEPAGRGYALSLEIVRHVFLPYGETLRRIAEKLHVAPVDNGARLPLRQISAGLLDQRLLLLRPSRVAAAIWKLTLWRRKGREHMARGFAAYQQGDLQQMRNHFIRAIAQDPLVLANLGIVSLLVESVVGRATMTRYRTWRHQE